MAVLLRGGTDAVEASRRLGLTGTDFRLVAIACSEISDEGATSLERVATALTHQLSVARITGTVARIQDTVYAAVESPDTADSLAALRRAALAARASAKLAPDHVLVIGISGVVPVAGFDEAREEADRVVEVLARDRSHDGCAEVGDVGLAVSMLRLAALEASRRGDRRDILDEIEDYDTRHSTNYGETLRTYLAEFGDPAAISAQLGVHTNTLRYRLRRLQELFGLDVTDEDARFALMITIRLRRA